MNQRTSENLWKPSSPTSGLVPAVATLDRHDLGSNGHGQGDPSRLPVMVLTRIEMRSPSTPESVSSFALR